MAAVVVTDGFSALGFEETRDKANSLKQHGVEMFVVTQGPKINTKEVTTMASNPVKEHIFQLEKKSSIKKLVNKIVKEICKAKGEV